MSRQIDLAAIKADYVEAIQVLSEEDRQFLKDLNRRTPTERIMDDFKSKIASTPNPPVQLIAINNYISQPRMPFLRYLIDELRVKTINAKIGSYRPINHAIIWGEIGALAFLLSRGADPMFDTESCILKHARDRQSKLQFAFDNGSDGAEFENVVITKSKIEPMLREGAILVELVEDIHSQGSYRDWALANPRNEFVLRFSRGLLKAGSRYQCVLLRGLVCADKAVLFSDEERAVISEKAAAEVAQKRREETSVEDILMMEGGWEKDAVKVICKAFNLRTLKLLEQSNLSANEIESKLEPLVRQGHLVEGQARRFTRFVRELGEPVEQPNAKSSSATPKSVAKSKAKAAPKSAALMALAAKSSAAAKSSGYAKGAAEAAPKAKAKAKKNQIDGIALAFSKDLPDSGFMTIARFLF